MDQSQPAPSRRQRRWRPRSRLWWVLGAVVVILLLGGAGTAEWFLSSIQVDAPPAGSRSEAASGTPRANRVPNGRTNILLMGHDVAMIDGVRHATRSDTLMVASFDPITHEVALLSIPRDTRVTIPGRKAPDKINAAYAYGGPKLAVQTVSQFLGVPLDGWIDVSVDAFVKMVDAVGGIDVVVPFNMDYDDPVQDLHIHLRKGPQHLDGYQAMGFVRDRYDDPDGGFGRMKRQQQFLADMMKKMLQPANLIHVPSLVVTLAKDVRTNLSTATMLQLVKIGERAGSGGLTAATLPTQDLWVHGISFQSAKPANVQKYVNRYIYGIDTDQNRTIALQVLNGTTTSGLAAHAAARLEALGYTVVSVRNAVHQNHATSGLYVKDPDSVAAEVLERNVARIWPEVALYDAVDLDGADARLPASESASPSATPSEASGAGAPASGWSATLVIGTDLRTALWNAPSELSPSSAAQSRAGVSNASATSAATASH